MPPKPKQKITENDVAYRRLEIWLRVANALPVLIKWGAIGFGFYCLMNTVVAIGNYPAENINALSEFVKNSSWGTWVGASAGVGALGNHWLNRRRGHRLVTKQDENRNMVEMDDPEKSSSGLDRRGRPR